jgi:hypothetical protein
MPVSWPVTALNLPQTGKFFMVKLNSPPSASEVAGVKEYAVPTTAVAGAVPLIVGGLVFWAGVAPDVALVGLSEELALPPPPHPASNATRKKPRKYRVVIPHPQRKSDCKIRYDDRMTTVSLKNLSSRQPRYLGSVAIRPEALCPRLSTGLPRTRSE